MRQMLCRSRWWRDEEKQLIAVRTKPEVTSKPSSLPWSCQMLEITISSSNAIITELASSKSGRVDPARARSQLELLWRVLRTKQDPN